MIWARTSSWRLTSARSRMLRLNISARSSIAPFAGPAECKAAHARPNDQSLFGIVQGGVDRDLRLHCEEELIKLDFPGYAIGGLAVGEGFDAMKQVISWVAPGLPADRPRYLMGVGFPRDIVASVALGIDMFDCVMPTRNGRNAYAFTAGGALRLRNSGLARDIGPIEADCDCYACRTFTRGAIRHFFLAGEMLDLSWFRCIMCDSTNG